MSAGGGARRLSPARIPPLVVAAAVVDDLTAPSLLLAGRRSAPPDVAGRWELPGGKVELGEDPVAALHRELAEELGVRVRLGGEVLAPPAVARGGAWPLGRGGGLRVWSAVVVAGHPAPLQDHDALTWVGVADWLAVDWLPADQPVVAHLAAALDPRA